MKTRAFSLIELLVAIAIIGILVGIVATGQHYVTDNQMQNEAESVLSKLAAIENELRHTLYKFSEHSHYRDDPVELRARGAFVNVSGVFPYDWSKPWPYNWDRQVGTGTPATPIERLMAVAYSHADARVLIKSITEEEALREGTPGFMTVCDPWGKEIVYFDGSEPGAARQWPHFVSAGLDKTFGTADDLHSHDPAQGDIR